MVVENALLALAIFDAATAQRKRRDDVPSEGLAHWVARFMVTETQAYDPGEESSHSCKAPTGESAGCVYQN